jgi:ribosome-binding ATPase YchF (GTP1/OBG family)
VVVLLGDIEDSFDARGHEQGQLVVLDGLVVVTRLIGQRDLDFVVPLIDAHPGVGVETRGGILGAVEHLRSGLGDLQHGWSDYPDEPMKKVAITGPPSSGKTTVWRALTGGASGEIATVEIPDPQLDRLAQVEGTAKRIGVRIQVADVHAGTHSWAEALGKARESEAILIVVPAFGGQDPVAALREVLDELVLADTGPVETRLASARKEGDAADEVAILEQALKVLGAGDLLRDHQWDSKELSVFAPLSPLTLKPLFVVVDAGEEPVDVSGVDLPSMAVPAALEAEVAGMADDEARELLAAYGIEERASDKLAAAVYSVMDLVTFYTTTEKETRAWEVRRGTQAPQAAGVVHSDMERGFIRAEVAEVDAVIDAGGWKEAKAAVLTRSEGKDYPVADGDVILFRFSV